MSTSLFGHVGGKRGKWAWLGNLEIAFCSFYKFFIRLLAKVFKALKKSLSF
jgi:hypothetical protein